MSNELIKIDASELGIIVEQGDKIILNPQTEDFLIKFLALEKAVEEGKKIIKEKLKERMLDKGFDNLTNFYSDNIRVGYRAYGSKYYIEKGLENEVPKEMYDVKTTYTVNSKEVDKFAKEHGGALPYGVSENDREKQVTFELKKNAIQIDE